MGGSSTNRKKYFFEKPYKPRMLNTVNTKDTNLQESKQDKSQRLQEQLKRRNNFNISVKNFYEVLERVNDGSANDSDIENKQTEEANRRNGKGSKRKEIRRNKQSIKTPLRSSSDWFMNCSVSCILSNYHKCRKCRELTFLREINKFQIIQYKSTNIRRHDDEYITDLNFFVYLLPWYFMIDEILDVLRLHDKRLETQQTSWDKDKVSTNHVYRSNKLLEQEYYDIIGTAYNNRRTIYIYDYVSDSRIFYGVYYKPTHIKIDNSEKEEIRKITNIETKLPDGNKNQQCNSKSHTGALKKKVRRKQSMRELKYIPPYGDLKSSKKSKHVNQHSSRYPKSTEYSPTFTERQLSNNRIVNTNSNSTIDDSCTSKINNSSISSGAKMESKADLCYNNRKTHSPISAFIGIFGYCPPNLSKEYEMPSSTKSPTFKSSKNGPMKRTASGKFLKPSVHRDSNLDKSTCTVAENSVNKTRKSSFSSTHNSGITQAQIPPSSSKILEKTRDQQEVIALKDNRQFTFEVIPEKSNPVHGNRCYSPNTCQRQPVVAQDIIDSSVIDDNINLLESDAIECCKYCVIL